MLISCVDPTGKCTLMQKDQRPGLQVFNQMDFLHRTESDPSKPNPFLSKLSTTPGKSEKDQLLPEIDPIKHCYGHNWKHMEVEDLYADHALFLFVRFP